MPSLSGEQCGWPQFLTLPPVVRIQPTLLPSVLYHQSPGDDKKSAQKCKTTFFTERTFGMRTYNEMTGELRKDTQKWQNMKQKLPQGSGILNHLLLSIKEAPFSTSHCLYRTEPLPLQNRSTDVPPSHQSAELTSMRKASVLWVDVRM